MIRRALARLVEGALLLLMVVLCADVFLGVFSRYVLVRTFTWYDEIARLCFVWIIFLGAAAAVQRGAHFRFHLLVDRLGPVGTAAAQRLSVVVIAAFGAVLVWQGIKLVELGQFQQTPVMGLSKGWVYAPVPIGGALMVVFALPGLWRRP
jgi:TRAP-type C4-dicarboxylate transport system permease small subunit